MEENTESGAESLYDDPENIDLNIDTVLNEAAAQERQPKKNPVRIIMGDSNAVRVHVRDPTIKNFSLSGQTLRNINHTMDNVKVDENDSIKAVVIHLGTNDIKTDSAETVTDLCIKAMTSVNERWQKTPVGFSSILPRVGKSVFVKEFNEKVNQVNSKIIEFCRITPYCHFIDNNAFIMENKKFKRSMYDARDSSGIHLSVEGAEELYENMVSFLISGESDELETYTNTPFKGDKRPRGSSSTTPQSAERKTKHGKT
jgi:lysophospholipase L1-like esterase